MAEGSLSKEDLNLLARLVSIGHVPDAVNRLPREDFLRLANKVLAMRAYEASAGVAAKFTD